MVELSNERVEQILHKETHKTEELKTILRGVYTRYMRLFEKYFADIDALNDDEIAGMKQYHEETRSLIKYYFMDIPQDACTAIGEYDKEYTFRMLGSDWHKVLFDSYEEFKAGNAGKYSGEAELKAAFAKQNLTAFYEAMNYVFRDAFGTGSKTAADAMTGIANLLFGEKK